MLTPALLLLAGMLAAPVVTGDWHIVAFSGMAAGAGAILYPLLQAARRNGWLPFEGASPEEFQARLQRSW
jgi:hypothetical protein